MWSSQSRMVSALCRNTFRNRVIQPKAYQRALSSVSLISPEAKSEQQKASHSTIQRRGLTSTSYEGLKKGSWKEWYSYINLTAAGTVGISVIAYYLWHYQKTPAQCKHKSPSLKVEPGSIIKGLPTYTMEDIKGHNDASKGIWVTYKNGVYDITKFIKWHPGGDKIKLAAGGSLEPFWALYAVHNTKEVYEMMEEMRIGNIVETGTKGKIKDAYEFDPDRHVALKVNSEKPFNAEPPPSLLVDNFITPSALHFVRNHLPVPAVDAKNAENFTLDICASGGVRLVDFLHKMGYKEEDFVGKKVQFEGLDVDPTGVPYGASIPVEKAFDPRQDVIIAFKMNDEPIPADHGFPLRAVIPGVAGARNVKWLKKIVISDKDSPSHWQQNDYKVFNPSIDFNTSDYTTVEPIMELPVQSAVCDPLPGTAVSADDEYVTVRGYAYSGAGRGIIRVDLSVDGGKTWINPELQNEGQKPYRSWAWTLWEATVPIPAGHNGKLNIVCKAVDSSHNVQPDSVEGIWNLRGFLNNSWHKVTVDVK